MRRSELSSLQRSSFPTVRRGAAHAISSHAFVKACDSQIEHVRYRRLITGLERLRRLFAGAVVLDFGASYALSMCALLELGAERVVGVEPDWTRVTRGRQILRRSGFSGRAQLIHKEDTRRLPFYDEEFHFVLANAVLEHIPEPRGEFISELWRVLEPGGYLLIADTPNKYYPKDIHTTGLWWVPWLPRRIAHRYAVWRNRFDPRRTDWDSSGWRGVGHLELFLHLPGGYMVPEDTRFRHRLLQRMGLPSNLCDPYPRWLIRKPLRSCDASG